MERVYGTLHRIHQMPHGLKAKRQRHGRRNDTNATTPLSVPKAHPQVYLKPVYAKGRYTVPIFL